MPLTKAQYYLLEILRDCDEEIVVEGIRAYVDTELFSIRTVNALLRVAAISDISSGGMMTCFRINGTGEAILRRPELADEVAAALLAQKPFTIKDDHVELMA